jgi:hypothetical protein
MPTILSGAGADTASTSYKVNAAQRVVDMRDEIFLLEPSAAPLALLVAKMGKKVAHNPKFEWLEDEAMPISDTVNGTFTTTSLTAIVVDNGSYFATNSTIKNPATGEVMRVTGVATNTLTVVRGYGSTAAQAIGDGATLIIMGGNAAENADAENPRQVQPANAYNYTEIVRTPFGVSGTLDKSDLHGGNFLAYLHKTRGIDHAKSIELKFLWGERKESDNTSSVSRATGGLWEVISTNSKDYSGTMTLALIDTQSAIDFRYGSKQKMLFVPRAVASALTQLGHSSLQIVPESKAFGLQITKMISTNGTYNIVPHDLFISDAYDEVAIVADLDNLVYRFMRDRDTKLRTNIQTPGKDGRIDEYLSEVGLERRLEKTHAKWLNCVA